ATIEPGMPVVSTKDASFISQSTAVLNGDINPNGVQTSYWYEYGTTNSLGSTNSPQLIGGGYVKYSAPASISGLKSNTTYYYRLTAQNQYGKLYGEILTFTTTNIPPTITYTRPSVETKDASSILQNTVVLNGVVSANRSTTYYWFEYGKNFGLGNTSATNTLSSGDQNAGVSADVSGLEPDTTYYYRLNAQNEYGTVNGNISVFTTQPANPPPQPVGQAPALMTNVATSVAKASATLNGQVNPNGSLTTYHFEYGKSTLFGLFTLDQSTDTKSAGSGTKLIKFSASITGLDSDSTYYYQLIAQNQYGTTRGAVYSFTTKK
ncbi:MAG: hypothetical protein ACREGC_01040, partial [Minisyncoccia bacterium]